MEPTIRKAKKEDFEFIKDFEREHYKLDLPEADYDKIKDQIEASFKAHVGREGTFVLILNNKVIGYLSVSVLEKSMYYKKQGELHMIHVKKEHRGKGYAKLLMKKADEFFKENNVKIVSVTTNTDNEISQSLYKKYGYKPWRITLKKWY